jgi:glycosyltransferase involved in cell wall biosynthesis
LAESFSEEKFVMVCPASKDAEYFERIKVQALNLPNVQFVDYVPFTEIEDYFSKARIFINTSKEEGFPNTFIQAFKNRTPILSMNVNPDSMLEKYDVGRYADGNFEQLKTDLVSLLTDRQLWQRLVDNACRYVERNHNIKRIIEEDKKMILKLLNKDH